jgi:hypothetical protein
MTEDLIRDAEPPPGGAGGAGGGGSHFASAAAPAFGAPLPAGFYAGGAPLGLLRTNWAPGESCQALFTDGQWHPATVQSAAPSGGFRVLFNHYAVPVPLPAASIRAAPRTGADEASAAGCKRVLVCTCSACIALLASADAAVSAHKRCMWACLRPSG